MTFLGDLLSAPGWIVGPLVLLAGAVGAAMCGWATLRSGRRAARRAVWWSVGPAAVGLMGAVYGGVRWFLWHSGTAPWAQTWPVLGYTALFGGLVSAPLLAWAVTLARRAPDAPAPAADYDDRAAPGPR